MMGDFYDGFESFWRQMLLRLLEPFPASEGIFDFWMIRWIGNYYWGRCLRNQLLAKSFTTKILNFDFFWGPFLYCLEQ